MTVDGWRIHIHDIEGVLSTAVCIVTETASPSWEEDEAHRLRRRMDE